MTSSTLPGAEPQLKSMESYLTQSIRLLQQLQKGDLAGAAQTAELIEASRTNTSKGTVSEHTPARAVLNLYRDALLSASHQPRGEEEESCSDDDEVEESIPDAATREGAIISSSHNEYKECPPSNGSFPRSSTTTTITTTESESEDESSSTSSASSTNREDLQRRVDHVPVRKSMDGHEIDVNAQLLDILSQIKRKIPEEGTNRQYKASMEPPVKVPTSAPQLQTELGRVDGATPEDEVLQMEAEIFADIDLRVQQEMKRLAIVRKNR
ncbi:unnamed protein product [Phytomonas sp. EM1]|nr:unnamed protein product [Phytomonas sp. EM1]|eukprot:CCW65743.1 unnamed protein product [Phytomonas sp. isolate EM1]